VQSPEFKTHTTKKKKKRKEMQSLLNVIIALGSSENKSDKNVNYRKNMTGLKH
jgi:hypothetical protein